MVNLLTCIMVNLLTFLLALHGTVAIDLWTNSLVVDTLFSSRDETAIPSQTFQSTEITDVKSCINLCKLYTSCHGVSFRRHGNVCVMSHTGISMDIVTVASDRKVGMVYWSKQPSTHAWSPDAETCSEGTSGPKCKTMCVSVEAFTPIGGRLYGNMITEGSKVVYDSKRGPLVEARCQSTGSWSISNDTTCLFTSFVEEEMPDGTSVEYRLCKENVNFDTAAYLCKRHGATVVQITTTDKLDFFRNILMQPENTHVGYWFDAQDVELVWITSDGQLIPPYIVNHHTDDEQCVWLPFDYEYRPSNSRCDAEYGYICEIGN